MWVTILIVLSLQFTECQKIVRAQAFARAIACDHDAASVADSIKIDDFRKWSAWPWIYNLKLGVLTVLIQRLRRATTGPGWMVRFPPSS